MRRWVLAGAVADLELFFAVVNSIQMPRGGLGGGGGARQRAGVRTRAAPPEARTNLSDPQASVRNVTSYGARCKHHMRSFRWREATYINLFPY
jgi:hypothetical protein